MTSILRTTIVSGVFAVLVLLGFWRLSADQQRRALSEMEALNEDMSRRLADREAMLDRLSRTQRLAHIRVEEQRIAENGDVTETGLLFVELDDDGSEIARQSFTVPGDVLFVDAWVVKFPHDDVASGDPLVGRSLVLLRRIYSDRMRPRDGFAIDTPGAAPPGYATGARGRFEQRLWASFWEIATDARAAAAMGVRVAQGEAVYKPVRADETYELTVDHGGGVSLVPLPRTVIAEEAAPAIDG